MTYGFNDILDAVLKARPPCGEQVLRNEVLSHFRARPLVEARVMLVVMCRWHMHDPSFPKIGRMIDRDHSTVMKLANKWRLMTDYYTPALERAEKHLGVKIAHGWFLHEREACHGQ